MQLIEAEGGTVERCVVTPRSRPGTYYYRSKKSLREESDTLAWIFGDDFFLDVSEVSLKTSAGVDQLHLFTHLKDLRMGVSTTDADVEKLATLRGLETIDLTGTQITDGSMVFLAGMPALITVYLDETRISDVGLSEFRQRKRISLISVQVTNVTKAGIDDFRSKFPEANIYYGNPNPNWPYAGSRRASGS